MNFSQRFSSFCLSQVERNQENQLKKVVRDSDIRGKVLKENAGFFC